MRTCLLYSFCTFLILTATAFGQDSMQRERDILNANLNLYQSGQYEKSEQNFSLMVSRLPESRFVTTNYLMLAKSQYKNGKFEEAINTSKMFSRQYAASSYLANMFEVMGNSYYKLNRFSTAIEGWESALSHTRDSRLTERLAYLFTSTVKHKLTDRDQDNLSSSLTSADGQVLLGIGIAEKHIDRGEAFLATETLQGIVTKYPDNRFTPKARNLLETGSIQKNGRLRLALLLPLSGYNEQIGNEIKEGVEFALDEYNKNNVNQVELVVRDYGDEISRAIVYYQELARNRNILAVLGPLEDDISAVCAALSTYENLALVSPTATDDDLVELSPHFFQLNSTISKRAEYLAHYAVDSLNIKRFATFSAVNKQFTRMVDRFSELVREKNRMVVSQEWYYPGDQDVNKQFMNIKRKGLRLTFMDSLFSTNPGLDTSAVDSLYSVYQEEQKELLEETQTKIDSADIPVTSVDGLFLPIYREDIKFIAPQIAYSNIQTNLLGNGDWYEPDELKKNKNYINGIVIISNGYLDEENWDYRKFRNNYRTSLKKTPGIYNVLGYDTFNYMLMPLKEMNSIPSRESYTIKLKTVRKYQGIYRSLEMDDKNRNIKLQLLKFDYGQILPLN